MKLLVDECLHGSLVTLARSRGHAADHVVWLGMSGWLDWRIMTRAIRDDYTMVTNNARDFRKLVAREPIHAGLIILIPNVAPTEQQYLFLAVMDFLAEQIEGDLINQVVEATFMPEGRIAIDQYVLSSRS